AAVHPLWLRPAFAARTDALRINSAEAAEANSARATDPGAMSRSAGGARCSATDFAQMAIQKFEGEFGLRLAQPEQRLLLRRAWIAPLQQANQRLVGALLQLTEREHRLLRQRGRGIVCQDREDALLGVLPA